MKDKFKENAPGKCQSLSHLPNNLYDYFNSTLKVFDRKTQVLELMTYKEVNVLGKGKYFGEVALNKNLRRNARIDCKEKSVFCTLEKEQYKEAVEKTLA